MVAKNRCTAFEFAERTRENITAVENIITEDEGHRVLADKTFRDEERLRDAFGLGLLAVIKRHTKTRTVTEQLLEARQVLRGGDEADFAHAALDERGERVINHRLVIDRLELLTRNQCQRIEP